MPLSDLVKVTPTNVALSVAHQGQFPRDHDLVQHRAERPAVRRDIAAIERTSTEIGFPASIHGSFAGTAKAFADSLDTQPS
ncbi:MAG: hypothetical protein LKM38_21175 [Pseudomonas veronii]|nr:hypothetical protein [Pseudomonas veronii]